MYTVSPNQHNHDGHPHNGSEISSHPSRSGGQPTHLSPLPCPGSKRSTRSQNPKRSFIFFLVLLVYHLQNKKFLTIDPHQLIVDLFKFKSVVTSTFNNSPPRFRHCQCTGNKSSGTLQFHRNITVSPILVKVTVMLVKTMLSLL